MSRQAILAESALRILRPALAVCRDVTMRIQLAALVAKYESQLA